MSNHTPALTTFTDQPVWVVDRDYLNEPGDDYNRVGFGQTITDSHETTDSFNGVIGRTVHVRDDLSSGAIPAEYAVRFRCLDDDDETYYGGVIDARALDLTGCTFDPEDGTGDEGEYDLAYNLDRWAQADAGAVHTLFKRSDLLAVAERTGNESVKRWATTHPGAHPDQGGDNWLPVYG